jgi:hypothetical protein
MRTGADISHWQASFDPVAYRAAGEDFVVLKATEGTAYTDPTFRARFVAAGAAGLARGAYHFARPATPPDAQADRCGAVARAGGWRAGDAWALDLEAADGQGAAALYAWSAAWVTRVRAALGGPGLFYTYPFFWAATMGNPPRIPGGALGWWARYDATPRAPSAFSCALPDMTPCVWQYSSTHPTATIGACDHNRMTDAAYAALFQGQEADVTPAELRTELERLFRLPPGATFDVPDGQTNLKPIYAALLAHAQTAYNRLGGLLDDEARVLAAVAAVREELGDDEGVILGALAALRLDLSPSQVAAIAAAVNVDEAAVARAVRLDLAGALAQAA